MQRGVCTASNIQATCLQVLYEYDDLPALHIPCEAELLGNDARVLHTSPAQTRNQSVCNRETEDRLVRAIEVHNAEVRGTDGIELHRAF
jgi:hypothetical protein